MSSTWATKPGTLRNLAGITSGTVTVTGYSHRDARGFFWNLECIRCGQKWLAEHGWISKRLTSSHIPCVNLTCRLGRPIPQPKPSKWEQDANGFDEPAPAENKQLTPQPVKREIQDSADLTRWRLYARSVLARNEPPCTYEEWRKVAERGKELLEQGWHLEN